jgi:hypothetical protein
MSVVTRRVRRADLNPCIDRFDNRSHPSPESLLQEWAYATIDFQTIFP